MSKRHKRSRHTTEAQRAAARANGAKSHGPVSDEGKAKAAMNALRHGLSASSLVLNNEDRERFNHLRDSYIAEYEPATQTEMDLVEHMTASKWLLQRCWTLETATLDFAMDKMRSELVKTIVSTDQATRTALAFTSSVDESNALTQLNRYAARHSREWHKAVDKLRTLQAERRADAAEKQKLLNEPGDVVEKETPSIHNSQRERREFGISQNEPEQHVTPMPPATCWPPRAPEVLAIK